MKPSFKKLWIAIGIIILGWTIFWFVKVRIFNHYEFIINVMMLTIGYCLVINYVLITIVYWAIKRLQKSHKI